MAAPKDFYKTLGVSESASADEIKKAYRKLAKKLHPDVTGGDKAKEARFKEASAAYDTLGDEKKRAAYDELRKNPFANMPGTGAGPGPGGFGGGVSFDLNEILNRMRGEVREERARARAQQQHQHQQRGPRGGGSGDFGSVFDMFGFEGGEPRSARGEDLIAKLEIELPEAALGAEKMLQVDGKRLTVKIPPGVTTGKTIRIAGQGQPGMRNAPAGDLLIEIQERAHPRFRRVTAGAPDVEVDAPVPVDVAILGGKADVPTLEGTAVTLTIPPGTSSGRRLRLRGKGAHIDKERRGDLYAVVQVHVPSGELPERAKELIAEFAQLTRK
jgi:DnaJ-class molecular chaperone